MALGDSPARGRVMESEKHRYVPIDTSHSEGRYKESCRSGSSGERCGGGSDHALLKDVFYLEHVGQVAATLSSTHFVWASVDDRIEELDASALLCWGTIPKDTEGHHPIPEIFAVKSLGLGPVIEPKSSVCGGSLAPKQLHRVEVHTFLRLRGKWVPKLYLFGHSSKAVVEEWAQRIQALLLQDSRRPKTLLVFVNPFGGKGSGVSTWKQVAPLFELAKIKVKVITTERAGHARDVMSNATKDDLNALDGVVAVGGDGFFNEVLNGLVMHRHKAPAAIMPKRLDSFYKKRTLLQQRNEQGGLKQLLVREASSDHRPLLQSKPRTSPAINQEVAGVASGACSNDVDLVNSNTTLVNSNPDLRIGLIPAGSTDTVVVSTTGSRDPLTSALHIILGDSMPLDIVRITGWKYQHENSAGEVPEVRYAASFAGYGFYGDVMRESANLRWLGPARYDMAGFKVFMQHKSYEGEISFLDIPLSEPQTVIPQGPWSRNASFKSRHDDKNKVVCLANCAVCASGFDFSHVLNSDSEEERGGREEPRWRTCRTKFHSVGAAVMSCRNDKAPEGVAAHAHLADGLLHLILIRECSRPDYLRQLLRLARRGADPFNFSFVDYYKTPLFTFTSHGDKESVWSVDGELLPARQLTGQVFRGLVNLFARGPETL